MTEPRTEAGRRLEFGKDWPHVAYVSLADILAIEAEAAAGPRDERLVSVVPFTHRAAAGLRDEAIELCPECGGQYSDLPGHRRLGHNVPGWRNESVEAWDKASAATREAAAGPREYHDLSAAGDILGHGHSYAEAAAGPRDEGLREALETLVDAAENYRQWPTTGTTDTRLDMALVHARAALAKASE